jgi:hypothetical protein
MTTTAPTFYAFELMNQTAVGPFATRDDAAAWMARVVPAEDQDGTPENATSDIAGDGYRVGDLAEVNDMLSTPEFETPEHAADRYRECYAEFYPAHQAKLDAAYKALDDFYLTLNEDNEDTPETLAEQERLFNLIHSLNGDARR